MIYLPKATLERLKMYKKVLESVEKEYISSEEIAQILAINPELVRKDLSYLKTHGKPKMGYLVSELKKELDDLFGVNDFTPMIVVGANFLGKALATYKSFERAGVKVVAILDTDERNVGERVGDLVVREIGALERVVRRFKVEICALCVSPDAAQETAQKLIELGVKVIWNFTGVRLSVPEDVLVVDEDFSTRVLDMKRYLLSRKK